MEAMLVGKPRSVAIGALRALLPAFQRHWGDLPAFREAGLDVLAKEGGGVAYNEKDSPAHLEQLYKQVQRARANYFRSVGNPAQLEQLYKELDTTAAKSSSPLQQGVLWLASRVQQQAINLLGTPKTKEQLAKVLAAVDGNRAALERNLANRDQLTLDRVEEVLGAFAQQVLGGGLGPFEESVIAGYMLETVREAARRPRKLSVSGDDTPRNDALTALLAVGLEPVRSAELNEAKVRYARMSDDEKNRRFNEFRRNLPRIIADVAPFAPEGFDDFCEAVEARLYPYPEPMQYVRTYARPIWTSGAQSNLFTNVNTPQGVQSLYDQATKSKQGNPVVMELARAFALHNFRRRNQEDSGTALRDTNLKAEFGWPTSVAQLESSL